MSGLKRCKHCGREGQRMTPILNRFWAGKIDGYKCTSPLACIRRMQQLGQWQGKRVLWRQDANGTRWTIRPLKGTSGSRIYTLTCEYREHRTTSSHFSIEAAKAHVEDWTASLMSKSLREYEGTR